ncbi:MAG: glycosyltransferase, partial [Calditrichota bacterium]
FTRKKLVIDFRDPWARSPWLEEQRQSSAYERFKTRIITRMERFVVRLADRCIFVTPEMCEDFKQFYPQLPQEKFQVFFNGYDPSNLPTQNGSGNGKHHEPITFVHTGVLYRRRDPRPVMYAVKELIDEGTIEPGKAMFRFVGGITSELASVKDLIGELELKNVFEFVPKVPYQESLRIMQNSDILVLLQPVSKLQIPGKFYDYICFGKPILAISEPDGAVDRLVDNEFGISTDYNSKDDIKRGIKSFLDGQYDNSAITNKRQRFDMSISIRQFEKMIDV